MFQTETVKHLSHDVSSAHFTIIEDSGSNIGLHDFGNTGKELKPTVHINYASNLEQIKMIIHLKNKAPEVYGVLTVICNDEMCDYINTLVGKVNPSAKIELGLQSSMIAIDLKLCTNDACLQTIRIVEGRQGYNSKQSYNCVQEFCTVVVDVQKELNGEKISKLTAEGGNSTSSTVTIVLSLFGTAFVLLVIIIICKYCWIIHTSQGSSVLPKIPVSDPFYLNMLFRKECDSKIAEMEAHVYEEIGEHKYDQVENQNEGPQRHKLVLDRVAASSASGILPIPYGRSAPKIPTRPLRAGAPQML